MVIVQLQFVVYNHPMPMRSGRFSVAFAMLGAGIFGSFAAAQQRTLAPSDFQAWLAVSDADRQQMAPVVEKDAGAEVLEWRVHVVDEFLGDNRSFQRVFYNYIRLKIFDDRGREKAATIDLPYRAPGTIIDVSGHTIKADGTVVDLDPKTVYRRTLERVGSARESVVSFAMPAVEKGAILEYRWKQTEDDNRFRYVRLEFQREFPIRRVTYFVKPLDSRFIVNEEMYIAPFNCKASPIKQENDGYGSTYVENVPAEQRETYSPSDANVRPWALLYYRSGGAKEPTKYWDEQGKEIYKKFREVVKSDAETKGAAVNAIGSATDEGGRIDGLAAFVRMSVRNVYDSKVSNAERAAFFQKFPKDRERTSTEILRSGLGMPSEINTVFAALAAQAGFEVRPALVADRGEILFSPQLMDRYFLDHEGVALRSGTAWKIVDVANKNVAPGMLPWSEEGMMALVGDSKMPAFVHLPFSPSDASAETRTAKLQLEGDGSLTGDVTEVYTGHRAEDFRREYGLDSMDKRVEEFRDNVTKMFPDADVTNIEMEGVDDPAKATTVHYHIDAPRYAQVTGKRILMQPNAFRRGQVSPFSAAQRVHPIEFPYAWKESDTITIGLPEGFALDNADAPGSLNFGKPGRYEIKMSVTKSDHPELTYIRTLVFGNESAISFDASAYPSLKKAFDLVQTNDAHTIALKGN